MTTTADGLVSVRAIAKTFASGRTEKLVYETLAKIGLPSGKVSQQRNKNHLHGGYINDLHALAKTQLHGPLN